MTDDLAQALDAIHGKSMNDGAGTVIGDTTNLPAGFQAYQDTLWETLTFQPNIRAPMRDSVGLSLAIQCADVKARDLSKSDMMLWRRSGRSYEEVSPRQHWLADLLDTAPNEIHTWPEFWRMVFLHLSLTQDGYILPRITRAGEVLELIPLPSGVCRPAWDVNGRLWYEINWGTDFGRTQVGGDYIVVPASRMIHLRGRLADGIRGISNLTLGTALFELAGAVDKFQSQLFGSDGRQALVFEREGAFGDTHEGEAAFRRLKEQLTRGVRRMSTTGEPLLLEAGLKAKAVSQTSKDAMTKEAFDSAVQRMCTLMEVPPHKIFAYETVKYENMAAANTMYAGDSLIPMARITEAKFRKDLIGFDGRNRDFYPEFDRMALLASDAKTMGDVLDKAVKNAAITLNEYRDRLPLSLNPIEAGDVRLVPVNMAMVDNQGKVVQQAATGQPGNDGVTENPPQQPD